MSFPSAHRTTLFRRGLVALATSATLLAGGLVAAPSAQSSTPPVVDVHRSGGTTVTTSMSAWGSTVGGSVPEQELDPATVRYSVALDASGGTMLGARAEVTVKKISHRQVRVRTIEMERSSTGFRSRGTLVFNGAVIHPGTYHVGVEVFTVVLKPDGTRVRHLVDVDQGSTVRIRRATQTDGAITTQATDGRPARIDATVRQLTVGGGVLAWDLVPRGTAHLSFDADGPRGEKKAVFVRSLRIGSDARVSTVVESRKGWWKVTYPGTSRLANSVAWIGQGVPGGCGC
ncbi:hypothetical protein [Promicromonospora iranensis]|uniref:Uncharacterized protein n=1 Tax=Promicromonospora iranensis TaxID=1105144 RepID=A0ABU2CPH4_9MICO|nr:hypothetical protein [Promicromonospora iranensis]MDR7383240.1 hypothetical protein [Promicromonospora iranensis]